MQNFCQIFSIVTIICFELMSLVCCQQKQQIYPWKVNENEEKVEEIVCQYARTKRKNFFSSFLKIMNNIILQEVVQENSETDLLIMSPENKFFLCYAILRLGYFGLEFVKKDIKEMVIKDRRISVNHLKKENLSPDVLPMFQCPKLQYIDLETGKPIVLSIDYFISASHLPDSFILYRQERQTLPIYPHKFVSEVDFESLDELRSKYNAIARKVKHEIEEMSVFPIASLVVGQVKEFVDIRKSRKPYSKFQDTFQSWNFCAQPRAHKIAVCRYVAECLCLKLDYRGYDEHKCQRREVYNRPITSEGPRGDYITTLDMIKCPALREELDKRDEFRILTIFLASGHLPNSMLLFQRLNAVNEDIQPAAIISNLHLHQLNQDRRRIREFLKSEYVDSTRKSIRQPELKTASQSPSVTYDRSVVEDKTISFMRMKEVTKPYRRFMMSYKSINISMWPKADIAHLCYTIFYDASYEMYTEEGLNKDVIFVGRSRTEARLVTRDAELLPDNVINTRQCPADVETSSSYFVMGTVHRDAIIMLVKYEHKDYAYPEAFVYNINEEEVRAPSNHKMYIL